MSLAMSACDGGPTSRQVDPHPAALGSRGGVLRPLPPITPAACDQSTAKKIRSKIQGGL